MAINFNNPGNIEKRVTTIWQGAIYPGDSARFVTFESLPFGYRALYKVLLTKIRGGTNTIRKIITSYAPPSDNNPTEAYVNYVSSTTGIPPDNIITSDLTNDIFKIGHAISRFETGIIPPSDAIIQGFNMAMDGNSPPLTAETSNKLIGGLVLAAIAYMYLK
jgi:hypothetical protein